MRSFQIQFLGAVVAILVATNSVNAQSGVLGSGVGSQKAGARKARNAKVDPNSALTAGSEVSFLIVEENEPTRLIVADTGELEIPGGLGRVSVAGLTTVQAAAKVKKYLEGQYYKEGKVTVRIGLNILPAAGREKAKVLIAGKVQRPGAIEFFLDDPKTLSEAVLQAGVTSWSNLRKVTVIKKNGETHTYDVKAILDGLAEDVPLEDGDKISVDERRFSW